MIISSETIVLLSLTLVLGFMFFLNSYSYKDVFTCSEEKEEIKEAIKRADENDIQKLKEKHKEVIRELRYAQIIFFLIHIEYLSIFTITAIIFIKKFLL